MLIINLCIFWICLYLKVFFQRSWKLPMLYLFIKLIIMCVLIIIVLFLCYVFCRRSLRKLCMPGWSVFLEVNKILIEHQFGFRKKCSTYMARSILMDELIKSLENGDYMIGVPSTRLIMIYCWKNYITIEFVILVLNGFRFIYTGSAIVFDIYQWPCECLWIYHAYFVCRWYQFVL